MAMIVAASSLYHSLKNLELKQRRDGAEGLRSPRPFFEPQYLEQGEEFASIVGTATSGQ